MACCFLGRIVDDARVNRPGPSQPDSTGKVNPMRRGLFFLILPFLLTFARAENVDYYEAALTDLETARELPEVAPLASLQWW